MGRLEITAPAKLNLTLDVLGKRDDGFHDMQMVMQSVTLRDRLTLTTEPGEGYVLTSNAGFLPADEKNLAVAAAMRLQEASGADWGKLTIDIEKRIPVCAGMAGGSSDAAAVLRGLNQLLELGLARDELAAIGRRVGSDVPYCVWGTTALAEGRGELLSELPTLPACWFVISKPGFSVSTPKLFARLDERRVRCRPDTAGVLAALRAQDLGGVARRMFNVFEQALPENWRAEIENLKLSLLQDGALGASMSGTGPTVFGIFDRESSARLALEHISELCPNSWIAQNI